MNTAASFSYCPERSCSCECWAWCCVCLPAVLQCAAQDAGDAQQLCASLSPGQAEGQMRTPEHPTEHQRWGVSRDRVAWWLDKEQRTMELELVPPEKERAEHLEWVCLWGGTKQENCNGHIQEMQERNEWTSQTTRMNNKTEVLMTWGNFKENHKRSGGRHCCLLEEMGKGEVLLFMHSVGPRHWVHCALQCHVFFVMRGQLDVSFWTSSTVLLCPVWHCLILKRSSTSLAAP